MLNFRKSITVVGVASSLLLVSACGTVSTPPVASPSESSTASKSAEPSTIASATASGVPASSIPVKGAANNGKGQYLQTTVSADDPAMKYNPDVVDATIKAQYSPEQITDAQRMVVTFTAEEGIDSILNDGNDVEAWWAANKDKIAPEFQGKVKSQLDSGREFVNRRSWGPERAGDFTYDYKASSPRISERKIAVASLKSGNDVDNSIVITMKVNYVVQAKDSSGKSFPVKVLADMMFAVRKDAASGKWLLDGQNSSYTAHAA